MLVLSRRKDESVVVNGNIRIVVVDIRGDKVRLGIEAPDNVNVFRSELLEKTRGGVNAVSGVHFGSLTEEDLENARALLTPNERDNSRAGTTAARSEGNYESMKTSKDGVAYKRLGRGTREVLGARASETESNFKGSEERC